MECPFCNTEFKNKYILLKHLKRKYNCKTNYSKDDYIDEKDLAVLADNWLE